jgi:hypothetical protein
MTDVPGGVRHDPITMIRAQMLGNEIAMLGGEQVGARLLGMTP